MAKRLAYADRYKRVLESLMDIPDLAGLVPYPVIDDLENHVRYVWTADEWRKLISVVKTGADLIYPEDAQNILWSILRGMHQPQTFDEEVGDCYNYPVYAPFNSFEPYNPYNDPTFIPPGYLVPPFIIGGGIGYEATDLIVRFDSFPIFANWWDIIFGSLPTVKITTVGDGQIELDLLNTIQGGYCVLKNNAPPNILDIFLGIFEPDIRIVDTQIDIAFPTELDLVISEEWDLEVGTGVENVLYCTFIPAVDDIFPPFGLPLRFGGGIRQVGLCGFESAGVIMGITDLRRVGEILETFEGGVWTPKVDLEPLHDAHDAALQAQITSNDDDIAILQATDVTHGSDIISLYAENDAQDILIQANADQNDAQDILIQANTDANLAQDILIAANAAYDIVQDIIIAANSAENIVQNSDIDALEASQAIQDLLLASHTMSILALNATEASKIRTTSYELTVPSQGSYDDVIFATMANSIKSHQFIYSTAQVIVHSRNRFDLASPNFATFRVNVDGVGGDLETILTGTAQKALYLSQLFTDVDTGGAVDISVDWKSDTFGEKVKTITKQVLTYTIIEYATGTLIPPSTFITDFDGGFGYILSSTADITATVSPGGNPGNAVVAFNDPSVDALDYFELEMDFGELKTVTGITFDWKQDKLRGMTYQLFKDAAFVESGSILPEFVGVWTNYDFEDFEAGLIFPFSCNTVRMRFHHGSGTAVCTVNIDNITFETA